MRPRIFLLPGFGEDHRCFRNLEPLLKSQFEIIHVDYRPVLEQIPLWDITPTRKAQALIDYYRIHPGDRLIGHSMGGYFSYVISTVQGNPVAMLGAFSDTAKIVRMTHNKAINYFATGSGLIKTPVMEVYLKQRVRQREYLDEMLTIQKNFRSFSNADMMKMLTLSYGEELPPALSPPLRIHAADDTVVRPPDEPYREVPGGHFSLVFHPEEVHAHLSEWLMN